MVPAPVGSGFALPFAGSIAIRIAILLAAAATATMVAAGPAAAQSLPADLLACRDIAGADERLACYDRAVERRADTAGDVADDATDDMADDMADDTAVASAPPPAAPAPASARAQTPPPAADAGAGSETAPLPSPEELFGRDPVDIQRRMDVAAGREELQQITGEVVELIEITPDRIAFKLDNGQIWRQTVAGRFLLREGQEVEIRRATLGSYLMSRAGSSRSIRVERAD